MADFVRAVGRVAALTGHAESAGGNGWRLLANAGPDAHQEVPHMHVHVVGGRFLGRMLRVPE
jgi:histidine triad (HIT) family protein